MNTLATMREILIPPLVGLSVLLGLVVLCLVFVLRRKP